MFGTYHNNEIVFSDDENDCGRSDKSSDSGSWENFSLRFGKYKGCTLSTMIEKGRTRQYLRYILKWPDIRPNTADNINQALAHYARMKEAARRDLPDDVPDLPDPPQLKREYSHA